MPSFEHVGRESEFVTPRRQLLASGAVCRSWWTWAPPAIPHNPRSLQAFRHSSPSPSAYTNLKSSRRRGNGLSPH